MKTYCTNESYWNELDPQFKKVYTNLAKQCSKNKKQSSKKSPLTKQAIAQLIQQGQYANDYHNAVSYSFGILSSQLTKKEKKIARICFKLSHSKYMAQLYQMVLINEKAHASLKVIAEIKGLINSGNSTNSNTSNTNQQPTNLSISLSQEPTKKPPEETDNSSNSKNQSPPLDLMLN